MPRALGGGNRFMSEITLYRRKCCSCPRCGRVCAHALGVQCPYAPERTHTLPCARALQGCLAHATTHPTSTLQQAYAKGPSKVLGGGGVFLSARYPCTMLPHPKMHPAPYTLLLAPKTLHPTP